MNVPSTTAREIAEGPYAQREQLEPDDLVYERSAATAHEQQQHPGQRAVVRLYRFNCVGWDLGLGPAFGSRGGHDGPAPAEDYAID